MEKALAPVTRYRIGLRLHPALEDIVECLHFRKFLEFIFSHFV